MTLERAKLDMNIALTEKVRTSTFSLGPHLQHANHLSLEWKSDDMNPVIRINIEHADESRAIGFRQHLEQIFRRAPVKRQRPVKIPIRGFELTDCLAKGARFD